MEAKTMQNYIDLLSREIEILNKVQKGVLIPLFKVRIAKKVFQLRAERENKINYLKQYQKHSER